MTVRLYYENAYQTEFDATLVATTTLHGRPAALLDRTGFYPTSGGQPHDTGRLADRQVVDVVAGDDGTIYHLLDAPLTGRAAGELLHGVIDWPRRYDHMQQHSGQHLISQVFYRHFGYETVSVHFGAEESTLDLDVETLSSAQLEEAEGAANDLVYENRPITAYFVDETELDRVPLRRPPAVRGAIRIVEIADFDYSACGGTHCRTTAEIGPIKFLRTERRRGQTRLTFLCGRRAYGHYATTHRLLTEAAALFSTEPAQVPPLIARNLDQVKALQAQVAHLTEALLRHTAADLRARAVPLGPWRLVTHIVSDQEIAAVKTLAGLLQEESSTVALLGCIQEDKASLIVARSADMPLDAGALLRQALRPFGGGGGGRPDFAQGGGVRASELPAVLEAARQAIERQMQA
ncbi:MAG: alanyl-tRNA editing protein [Litorilinea sp.]|nr:MAG: alanyl-tRNA editing protein [Litorilinea sp.]